MTGNVKKTALSAIAVMLALLLIASLVLSIGTRYYGWFESEPTEETPNTDEPAEETPGGDNEETEADFYYNGVGMYFEYVYYLYFSPDGNGHSADSCYYINSDGETVYVYTAEDVENGLTAIEYVSSSTSGCVEDSYASAVCFADDGMTYFMQYIKTNHYYKNGKCSFCGAAEE